MLGQLLQVEQLPDGTAPARQENLVQRPVLLLRRPALEAGLVTGHGGEVVPDPAEDFLALLQADEGVGGKVRAEGLELGGGFG